MKRKTGLDIIRTIAIIFVIGVHFFKNTSYYYLPLSGKSMFIMTILRWLTFTCIPLFLLLTGYLNNKKELNKNYYKGIKKVLTSYIIISIICIIVRIFVFDEKQRILYWLLSIFNFTANGNAWYIEMYIGLFLLIPFLNILYNNLKTKEHKKYLIITMIILTTLPSLFNSFEILGLKTEIIPNYWVITYPLTYYFIGAYISEYQPNVSKVKCLVYICLTLLIHSTISYVLRENQTFSWDLVGGYQNILSLITSINIFLLFYKQDIKVPIIRNLIESISICSLDMYLFSYLVDIKVYEILNSVIDTPIEMLACMIPITLIIVLITYALALLKKFLIRV